MSGKIPDDVELVNALGFSGKIKGGLVAHPNGKDIIYPLGSTIVIKNIKSGKQVFLKGHTDKVTCLTISSDGSKIASGQKTHQGFKSSIFIWDFEAAKTDPQNAKFLQLPDFHTVKVQSVTFSPSGKYLASLGGTDDNMIAIWNASNGKKVSIAQASSESALTLRFYNNSDNMLVSAGYYHVRRWVLEPEMQKLDFVEANLGSLRRIVTCIDISNDDSFVFAGSTTGDVFKIALEPRIPAFKQAGNELFRKGIHSLFIVNTASGKPQVLLGCGSGAVVSLDAKTMKKVSSAQISGEVTSVAPIRSSIKDTVKTLYAGTSESNIYVCDDISKLKDSFQLRASCHYNGINDVAFLDGCEDIFVTCSMNDIRVWNANKLQELLRIQVPNINCTSVALPKNGDLIISGWSDGKIRGFKPVSGALQFIINDAHPEGVTAVAVTSDCQRIISGGAAGAVRFWDARSRKMQASLKEHKSAVTSIAVRSDDNECTSSSDDGSCIQWDLKKSRRTQAIFASTMFKSVRYHPDESQLLTCGSDRRATYWCAYEGNAIRILEASQAQINAIDIDRVGDYFVSGGNASQLKVFSYDEGDLCAVGDGHSGAITAIKISPDHKRMISVGSEGAIFVWKFPYAVGQDQRDESKSYK